METSTRTGQVWIDAGCISCGLCESLAPEVFHVPAGGASQVQTQWRCWADREPAAEERLRGARDACPVDVIRLDAA